MGDKRFIGFQVDSTTKKEFDKIAWERRMTSSELCRQLVDDFLGNKEFDEIVGHGIAHLCRQHGINTIEELIVLTPKDLEFLDLPLEQLRDLIKTAETYAQNQNDSTTQSSLPPHVVSDVADWVAKQTQHIKDTETMLGNFRMLLELLTKLEAQNNEFLKFLINGYKLEKR